MQQSLSDPEEIKSLASLFLQTFDTDRDGLLRPEELFSLLSQLYRRPYKDSSLEKYLSVWDANGNGLIDNSAIEKVCRRYLLGEGQLVRKEKPKKKALTRTAQAQLEVARRIFRMFDRDGSDSLGAAEMRLVMLETYKMMGREYEPSEQEVVDYIYLINGSSNPTVRLEDYEEYVLKSLAEAGIQVEEEQMKV